MDCTIQNTQAQHITIRHLEFFCQTKTFEDNTKRDSVGIFAELNHKNADVCLIAFRGSSNNEDWLVNMGLLCHFKKARGNKDPKYKNSKNCKEYTLFPKKKGYQRSYYWRYTITRDLLLEKIKKSTCKHVLFTGHSLGASMATISAIEMAKEVHKAKKSVNLMTWGASRFMTEDAVNDGRIERSLDYAFSVYRLGDITSHMPPKTIAGMVLAIKPAMVGKACTQREYGVCVKRADRMINGKDTEYGLNIYEYFRLSRLKRRIDTVLEHRSVELHGIDDEYLRLLRRVFYEDEDQFRQQVMRSPSKAKGKAKRKG